MEMNKMYQGKGHILDIYAMDDNKNLYKVFSENYVRDVDEEWCIYNIAGNEFIYGKGFKAQASDNMSESNRFNPYYIKSELLKF